MNFIPAKPQIVLLDAGTVSWISKIASGVQKNPRADNDHKHACLSSSSLQYTLRYLKSQRTRCLFVSATSLFSADSSSSSANASAGVRQPSTRMGLLSVSSTISCSSRAMEGATGVRLGRQRRIMPFLFRQVRIHLAQGATPLRLVIWTISNLTGVALSIRQRAYAHSLSA